MLLQDEIASDKAAGARRLVAEYGSRLYETAICLCGSESDAEDYVFRTFEKVVERISQFKGYSSIFTWMYEMMVNIIRTDARRKGANALAFPETLPEREDPAPDASAALAAKDEILLWLRVHANRVEKPMLDRRLVGMVDFLPSCGRK